MPSIEELQLLNQVLEDKSLDVVNDNKLTDEHFPIHKETFEYIVKFDKEHGHVPTSETVMDKFETFEPVETEVTEVVVKALKEDWLHRTFKPKIVQAADLIGDRNSLEAIQLLKEESTRILQGFDIQGQGYGYVAHARERYESYMKIHGRDPNQILGMTTGFQPLDLAVNGLEYGMDDGNVDYFLVFAPTNMGKSLITSFMMQASWWEAITNPDANIYPAYFALEQTAKEIAHNWDNVLARVSKLAITRGTMSEIQRENYELFVQRLEKMSKEMMIYDIKANGGKAYTVSDIQRILEREGHTNFALDQLSKVGLSHTMGHFTGGRDLRQRLFDVSAQVRQMILDTGIPGYVVAQANRASAKKVKADSTEGVDSEDIGEAYAIVQDASKGISITKVDDTTFRITVTKTRNNGSGQTFLLKYHFETGLVSVLKDDVGEQFF